MSAVSGGGEDLIARLQRSLHDLGEHRLTHVVWRDWLLKDPANEQVNPHAGSAEYHDATIKNYDRHLANIEEAIRRLASAGSAPAPSGWRPIETAPKSAADGSAVAGVYLLGFCFDPDLDFDPQACIDIVWWEPLLPNRAGGRGKWCRNNAGEATEVSPTHWQPLPAAPTQEPSHAD